MYIKELDTRKKNMENNMTEGCSAAVEVGSREWLLQTQIETFEKIIAMTKRKNADYAGKGGDAFNNFTRVEGLCPTISTEQGFFVRLTDKFSRIGSFIQNGELQVKDESVEDTLLDLSNYAFLFYAYLKAKKIKLENAEYAQKKQAEIHEKAFFYDQKVNSMKEYVDRETGTGEYSNAKNVQEQIDNCKPITKAFIDSQVMSVERMQEYLQELENKIVRLEKNNANILHENKRLAREVVAYKHLGTPSQIQVLFNKVEQVLDSKVETHADGVKNFVPRDHKSFIGSSTTEGNCDEDYSNVKNGLEHN